MSCWLRSCPFRSRGLWLVACLLASHAAAWPQAPPEATGTAAGGGSPAAQAARDRYAAEPLIAERLDTVYRYSADGTGSKLDTDVLRPQTEAAARSLSLLSLPYAAGSERMDVVYVRVRKGDGTVVTTPPADARDQLAPVTQAAPLYSDLHLLGIPVRGLAAGDRLEYQVRRVFLHAEAKDQFWGLESFGGRAVVLERSVELRVPAGKGVLVSSPKDPAKVTQEGAEKVYRWTGSQPRPTAPRKTGGGARDALAAAGAGADAEEDNRASPIAWTTFGSWAEVGAWYRSLTPVPTVPEPEVKARADAIVYGLTSPADRTRALYRYVSLEVRSIDVPFGTGSYPPHTPVEVLRNQYGDSNDKNALLVALLRAENLPAATVLVGGGPPLDDAVPAPGWFHSVITLAGEPSGEVWLDTTPEVAPYRVLPGALRDRQALVIPAEAAASLRRSPAALPFAAADRFVAKASLNAAGDLAAHVDLTFRGDGELRYREGLHAVSEAQWDRIAEFYMRSENLPGQPRDTVADQASETTEPLHLSFDLRQGPYGDWADLRILPLEPGLNLPMTGRRTAPDGDLEFGGRRTDTAQSRITLPPGYSADLPPEVHLRTDFASLDKASKLEPSAEGQVLVTERILQLKVDKLPASGWGAYRDFLDEAARTEPWIQLTTGKPGRAGSANPPAPGENRPEAADLVQEANAAIAEQDWPAATRKLDQADGINPRQAFLWSSYGVVAGAGGRTSEAIGDYQRELVQHPEEAMVSRLLAATQARSGDRAGALQTLGAAVARNDRDEQTVRMLGDLEAETDPPTAEKTLRAGLLTLPASVSLKLALGAVLLGEAKREEGGRLLGEVLNTSGQPEQLNDAAFALGDASLALPLAEGASRRSIQMLNAVSARDGGQAGLGAALLHSRQLVSAWDTYGWILFHEGNLSEAEPWLRAACADSLGGAPGRHLAALLQKQGRAAEANRILQADAVRPRNGRKELSSHLPQAAFEQDGHAAFASAGAQQAVPPERSFALGRPVAGSGTRAGADGTGSARFVLDYALGAAPRAILVSGDRGLAIFTDALAKLDTHTLIPPGSPAHLLRAGVLRCREVGGCVFTLSAEAAVD